MIAPGDERDSVSGVIIGGGVLVGVCTVLTGIGFLVAGLFKHKRVQKTDQICTDTAACENPTNKRNNPFGKCQKEPNGLPGGKCEYRDALASRRWPWIWIGTAMIMVGVCVVVGVYLWSKHRRS
jgi:hypothetical protein